ncbi:LamG domain-containing protein [Candidatus Poribacteria bacterium]|nr:LamG domain-containing protein [Candidatus Poribacteria bacterium]
MFINHKLLLSVVLLLGLVLPVFSFQPSGGVLMLDGEDDYAILPLAEHGYIFPRNTDEFTVEVWFYPRAKPEPGKSNIILSQQVRFGLQIDNQCRRLPLGEKGEVCAYGTAYLEGGGASGPRGMEVPIKKDQWNYLAVIFMDRTLYVAYNNQIYRSQRDDRLNVIEGDLGFPEWFKSFCVGGFAKKELVQHIPYFHGEIDAIRFSDIARYDLPAEPGPSPFDPPHRFESDAHTLAFWDFNEKEGADRFEDESGNGYTLIGMNGAATSRALAVNPANTSLTTTWGQIKLESRDIPFSD